MNSIKRIFDLLEWQQNLSFESSFGFKYNGEWKTFSKEEYKDISDNVSYGLLKLGIQPGDKIATISNNRPEWNFVDMGISQIGAVHVPLYPNINEEEYEYILKHSESKYVFISSDIIYSKIKDIVDRTDSINDIYTFEKLNGYDKLWTEVADLGKENKQPEKLEELKSKVQETDLATIIYTSGTTGNPKGVMLSHKNILSNVKNARPLFPIEERSKIISYLPVCHVYERLTNYVFQLIGSTIYYVENMGTIVDNIQEIRPDAFSTVPRLLEKVYDRIMYKGRNLNGISKKIFFWAVKTGHQYNETGNPFIYKIKLAIADKLVFSKWRKAFGDNIKFIISGGAALQERLGRIFYAARISVLEGYGLTETSPVLAVNNFEPNSIRFGTVGPPLKNVVIRIADDGEILAKGDNIMMGYYKEPEMTKEVIDEDGWFHTGDNGKFIEDRFLKITGRKKSIFKTSMGKYISPENIEDKLRESRFIEQAMIVGENQKFVAALIVPSFQVLKNWALMKGIGYMNDHEAIKNPKIRKRIQEEIDIYNKSLNSYEKIMRFELLPEEWTIETGEITPTLKVKRNYICKKYEKVILKAF